jgi:hypothetical protein
MSSDGNTIAVGAYGEDSNATGVGGDQTNNSSSDSGAAYVFTRSGTTWSQQAYIKASNTDSSDRFGWSLSISHDGNTLAVGAYGEDSLASGIQGDQSNNSGFDSGAVYIFTRSGTTWSQQAYIKGSNNDGVYNGDNFGWSVSLNSDGNTLAVGSPYEDSNAQGIGGDGGNNSTLSAGASYLFKRIGTTWSQQAYIKASNTDTQSPIFDGGKDEFGWSLSLNSDGSTLVVGAPEEESDASGVGGDQTDNSSPYTGAVYIY